VESAELLLQRERASGEQLVAYIGTLQDSLEETQKQLEQSDDKMLCAAWRCAAACAPTRICSPHHSLPRGMQRCRPANRARARAAAGPWPWSWAPRGAPWRR
jgi:hypothetical protein